MPRRLISSSRPGLGLGLGLGLVLWYHVSVCRGCARARCRGCARARCPAPLARTVRRRPVRVYAYPVQHGCGTAAARLRHTLVSAQLQSATASAHLTQPNPNPNLSAQPQASIAAAQRSTTTTRR
eukprot:scaffold113327_cov66-Phaeocystis_antarctica.AAC.8